MGHKVIKIEIPPGEKDNGFEVVELFESVLSLISPNRLVFWWSIFDADFGPQTITIILKIQGLVLLQGRMGLVAGAMSAAIHASGVAWDAA